MWLWTLAACVGCKGPGDTDTSPTGEAHTCDTDLAWDGEACVPAACGAAPWGDAPIEDGTVFVREGADGDGTMDAPFGSLEDAIDAAPDAAVRIAAGTYVETLELARKHDGLRLQGRCADLVTLEGRDLDATVLALGARATVEVSGMTITGGHRGLAVFDGGTLDGEDLVVTDNATYGVGASDAATLTLARSLVYGNADEDEGIEVSADDGATVTVTDSEVRLSGYVGFYAGDGGRLVLSGLTFSIEEGTGIVATREGALQVSDATISGGAAGETVIAGIAGSSVDIRDTTIADALGYGVVVSADSEDAAATVLALDGVTFTNMGEPGGDERSALGMQGWVEASLTDVTVEGTAGLAVMVAASDDPEAPAPVVTFDQLTVRDTYAPDPETPSGASALSVIGGTVTGSGLAIDGSVGLGVFVRYASAVLDIREVDVANVDLTGVYVIDGGTATISNGTLHDDSPYAVEADGAGSTVTLTDVDVVDLSASSLSSVAVGAYALDGATIAVSGGEWSGIEGYAGLAYGRDAALRLSDLTVSDTLLAFNDLGAAVGGFQADFWATVSAERVVVDGVYGGGFTASYATLALQDVAVSNVGSGGSDAIPWGVGLIAGADASLTDVTLTDIDGYALLAGPGTATCERCAITGARFAGVQLTGEPAEREFTMCWDADEDAVVVCTDPADCARYPDCTGLEGRVGELTLTDSTIDGVEPHATLGGGVGVIVDDTWGPTRLALQGTQIHETNMSAMYLKNAASVEVRDSVLDAAAPIDVGGQDGYGSSVFATGTGAAGLLVEGTTLSGSTGVAAVFLDAGSGTFTDDVWSGNTTDLLQQGCEGVETPPPGDQGWATAVLCPDESEAVLEFGAFFVAGYSSPLR